MTEGESLPLSIEYRRIGSADPFVRKATLLSNICGTKKKTKAFVRFEHTTQNNAVASPEARDRPKRYHSSPYRFYPLNGASLRRVHRNDGALEQYLQKKQQKQVRARETRATAGQVSEIESDIHANAARVSTVP